MINFFAGQFATARASQTSFGFQNANQSRMILANGARPDLNPAQVKDLQQRDLALEMQGANNQLQYQVALLMQEAADKQRKKDVERRQQAIQNGSLYG
ncbi:MAG: hypothetical protein K2X66_18510 [Cyanobacteria bacterium]|nr:hypothetical protein [Cyanobacteriota bacterium]